MIFRTPLQHLLAVAVFTGLVLAGDAQAQTAERANLFERMARQVKERERDLIELRHDIHQHPELSGSEERTAGLVASRLADLGFDVRAGVGGHGVVGVIEGERPGPVVAFRADMDAVRSSSEDPVEYRSTVPGVRHICGHDVHTAIGVGLAEGFAAIREDLPGTVMLVFQPAEERGTGAKAMLADGIFDAVRPDAIFSVHTAPFNLGEVATVAGGMMAGRASVSVTVQGTGDLDEATSMVRTALEGVGTVPSHLAGAFAPEGFIFVELSPGAAEALPGGGAVVRGQVMTLGEDRDRAEVAVMDVLGSLELPGVTFEVRYDARFMEGVTNAPTLVDLANAGIRALAPDVAVSQVPGAIPAFSEDFGSFQARVPGVMYFLGVNNPETGTVGVPHSPNYVADDGSIVVGTRVMLAAMLERLSAE